MVMGAHTARRVGVFRGGHSGDDQATEQDRRYEHFAWSIDARRALGVLPRTSSPLRDGTRLACLSLHRDDLLVVTYVAGSAQSLPYKKLPYLVPKVGLFR